jgi:hypothetical protein
MQETIQFVTEWPATLCHRQGLECTHAEVIPRWTVEFSCCKTGTGQQKKSATTKGKRELFTTLKSGNLEAGPLHQTPNPEKTSMKFAPASWSKENSASLKCRGLKLGEAFINPKTELCNIYFCRPKTNKSP